MRISAPNYTQTPNDLFDHWLPHLSEGELKVLLVVMRKTFGWHKVRDRISASQLSKITGLTEETVRICARTLEKKGVIRREVVGEVGTQSTYYEIVIEEVQIFPNGADEQGGRGGITPPGLTAPQKKTPYSKETAAKEKATAAAAPFAQKKQQQQPKVKESVAAPVPDFPKPRIHQCLEKVDIPDMDKYEITEKYDEETVKNAITWALHPNTKIVKGLAPAMKWACEKKPIPLERNKSEIAAAVPVDISTPQKQYFRIIQETAVSDGVMLHRYDVREAPDYVELESQKIYFKDRSFLDKFADYLKKKAVESKLIFRTIARCQTDLTSQVG
jgi:phage replication O-like protein O